MNYNVQYIINEIYALTCVAYYHSIFISRHSAKLKVYKLLLFKNIVML
jgi:hypothetical protein